MIKYIRTERLSKGKPIVNCFSMNFIEDQLTEDQLNKILTDFENEIMQSPDVNNYKFITKDEPKYVKTEIYLIVDYKDLVVGINQNKKFINDQINNLSKFYNDELKKLN